MKRIAAIAALVAATALAVAPMSSAAKPADPGKGGRCVAAGTSLLAQSGLMSQAAQGTLNYAPLLGMGGTLYLPLSTVISLHRTNPEIFPWCANV
jgi:hypothetical protein